MKRPLFLAAALTLAASSAALAQPDATTDVDGTTTAAEQAPLAPEQAQPAPRPLTIEDILSGAAPYEPPPAPATAVSPEAPAERLVVVPASPAPQQTAPLIAPQPRTVFQTTPRTTAPVAPPPTAPVIVTAPAGSSAPSPALAPAPLGSRPVLVTDLGTTVGSPRTATDAAYENRVLGVFHTAQGRQGPLDGRWLIQSGGVGLFTLQLSDPGAGESRVEGAWRNLRNAGANSSGFVDEVSREGDQVVVRFTDTGYRRTEVRLRPDLRGGWMGEATWPEGRQNVVMNRDQGLEVLAFSVPAYIPPPPPPPPKAKPAPKRKQATAKKRRPTAAQSRARAKRR